jgi:hypothetical protein
MTDLSKRAPGWVPDLTSFGARLALVRQHVGWGNVKQAAEACGIPPETWRSWERDGMTPRSYMNACMKIAGVTQVDLNWLAVGPAGAPAAGAAAPVEATHGYTPLKHDPRVVATIKGLSDRDTQRNMRTTRTSPIGR